MSAIAIPQLPVSWLLRALRPPTVPIGLAIICLLLDFVTGPFIDLSAGFVIPVFVSAWAGRPGYAFFLAVLQPLVRLTALDIWHDGLNIGPSAINAVIRVSVLLFLAYLVGRSSRANRLANMVRPKWGGPPACSLCAKIRDEDNNWQPMEVYLSRHPESLYSHSLCPDCLKRDYRDQDPPG